MKVFIDNKTALLRDQEVLGEGGEARVFRWRGKAVKIFHPIDPATKGPERAAAQARLALSVDKLENFPKDLSDQVVAPKLLVRDKAGAVIGYVMALIEGAEDVRRLGRRRWRQGAVSNADVMALFAGLRDTLRGLHARGVVVGDLNHNNAMFRGRKVWIIDADSMQFGPYPCPVAHERFLAPELYGVDLMARPVFSAGTDWFAFAVMLFESLLYAHPFGGVHPTHGTLLRRAEARCSLFDLQVMPPRSAAPVRALPTALADWLRRVFEEDLRVGPPDDALNAVWTTCGCGLSYGGPACPTCHSKAPRPVPPLIRHNGRCKAVEVLRPQGQILAAVLQDGLKVVSRVGDEVRREDGATVMTQAVEPGMRFVIGGRTTWLGHRGQLVGIRGESVVDRWTTPEFDANAEACYRLDGGWLVESLTGVRVGQILEGRTWFRVGERLGFGFYRAGLVTVYFMFEVGRPGLRNVMLPPIEGRLLDVQADFDAGTILFQTATERAGREYRAAHVIDDRGRCVGSMTGTAQDCPALSLLPGKAIRGHRILCPTDEGILTLEVDPGAGTIREGALFTETKPFVTGESALLAGSGGSIYAVTPKEIVQLTLT